MFGKGCAFTGHRHIEDADRGRLRQRLSETVESLALDGIEVFYCGGAVGFDAIAAEVVLEKRERLGIKLCIVVPHEGQEDGYTPDQRRQYERILAAADERVTVSTKSDRNAYHIRNRYMVDRAEVCVAYLAFEHGGTAYTVKYAEKKSIPVINIADSI